MPTPREPIVLRVSKTKDGVFVEGLLGANGQTRMTPDLPPEKRIIDPERRVCIEVREVGTPLRRHLDVLYSRVRDGRTISTSPVPDSGTVTFRAFDSIDL